MPTSTTENTYRVTRADAIAGLASLAGTTVPGLDVQSLGWEGSGPEGNFVVEHTTSVFPDDPQPPFERVARNFTRFGFVEVRGAFFPSIPMQTFVGVRAEVNSTYVVFTL